MGLLGDPGSVGGMVGVMGSFPKTHGLCSWEGL